MTKKEALLAVANGGGDGMNAAAHQIQIGLPEGEHTLIPASAEPFKQNGKVMTYNNTGKSEDTIYLLKVLKVVNGSGDDAEVKPFNVGYDAFFRGIGCDTPEAQNAALGKEYRVKLTITRPTQEEKMQAKFSGQPEPRAKKTFTLL